MKTDKNLETPIFQLTVGEFLTILNLTQKAPVINTPQIPDIFGVKTLREITGYSYASIYAKTSKNQLKHFKRDGKLFFRRDDIMQWLTANPVATTNECCKDLDEKLITRKRRLL